jgi:general nucleoside transport system ATP-binding protein
VSATAALTLDHVAKRFGPAVALSDASLHVMRGSLHAVLGENGAGKTTLMRIAFGLEQPDAGIIAVDGTPVRMRSPLDAIGRGIGMVHQHFTIVPAMTVAENVALGGHGRFRRRDAEEAVLRVTRQTGLALDPAARAGDLAVGAQQRLEIVKALSRGAQLLILDEPTAVLTPLEAQELLALLRRFTTDGGTVVLITHKMREALGAADTITVLRQGRTAWTGAPGDTDERALARATVGDLADRPPRARRSPGDVVVAARGVHARDPRGVMRVRGISLEVRAGEVLGIAGVEGAGQHELLRVLAGRLAPTEGTVTLPDTIGFIPEDRQRDALMLGFSLTENVALRGVGRARGRLRWSEMAARTDSLLRRFDVRPARSEVTARALSGGNQQRLVLARELADAPAAVIAENPTRGLDVAATAATHRQLLAMRDAGAAVVVYSGDLDELLDLSDRVLVIFQGVARAVPPERDAIAIALLGGAG